ncbi:hypothetical protein PybrP1_011610 [[Pythium] brassicae (nom. inval.)]|nr:hypothetical protein PybrP1_011610 [[Pythium] brassicae (nom. inval.)]
MVGTRVGFTRVSLAEPAAKAAAVKSVAVKRASGTPTSAHVGCSEYAMTVAARVYFSGFYRLIYFFTVVSSLVCVVWTGVNHWRIPSSLLFISLEITRFWTKWCNIFDVVALVLSLVSVAMYFNEEGVLGELEEVAADSVLALRNAVQYIRLAIFLKNRTEKSRLHDSDIDIDFETLASHPDDEREAILNAESGVGSDSDDDSDVQVLTAH